VLSEQYSLTIAWPDGALPSGTWTGINLTENVQWNIHLWQTRMAYKIFIHDFFAFCEEVPEMMILSAER
jgi:alpha-L-arabinofuranosidase